MAKWSWNLDMNGVFTVKVLSLLADEKILKVDATAMNNLIPKKVGVFTWRALKGKIPVRMEL